MKSTHNRKTTQVQLWASHMSVAFWSYCRKAGPEPRCPFGRKPAGSALRDRARLPEGRPNVRGKPDVEVVERRRGQDGGVCVGGRDAVFGVMCWSEAGGEVADRYFRAVFRCEKDGALTTGNHKPRETHGHSRREPRVQRLGVHTDRVFAAIFSPR